MSLDILSWLLGPGAARTAVVPDVRGSVRLGCRRCGSVALRIRPIDGPEASMYYVGETVELSAAFRDRLGALADPTSITLRIKSPAGVTSAKTYAAGDITKDSTGRYHYDLLLTASGRWEFRFEAAGAVAAIGEEEFQVLNAGRF